MLLHYIEQAFSYILGVYYMPDFMCHSTGRHGQPLVQSHVCSSLPITNITIFIEMMPDVVLIGSSTLVLLHPAPSCPPLRTSNPSTQRAQDCRVLQIWCLSTGGEVPYKTSATPAVLENFFHVILCTLTTNGISITNIGPNILDLYVLYVIK